MIPKSTLRMVATLLLLTGVGWLTGTLPWPFASSPASQSARNEVPQVAAAVAGPAEEAAPADEASIEIPIDEDEVLVDDAAEEDSSVLGIFEGDPSDDSDDPNVMSADLETTGAPMP